MCGGPGIKSLAYNCLPGTYRTTRCESDQHHVARAAVFPPRRCAACPQPVAGPGVSPLRSFPRDVGVYDERVLFMAAPCAGRHGRRADHDPLRQVHCARRLALAQSESCGVFWEHDDCAVVSDRRHLLGAAGDAPCDQGTERACGL
jgi:hypothetical protein